MHRLRASQTNTGIAAKYIVNCLLWSLLLFLFSSVNMRLFIVSGRELSLSGVQRAFSVAVWLLICLGGMKVGWALSLFAWWYPDDTALTDRADGIWAPHWASQWIPGELTFSSRNPSLLDLSCFNLSNATLACFLLLWESAWLFARYFWLSTLWALSWRLGPCGYF